jgi:hypothetical protein
METSTGTSRIALDLDRGGGRKEKRDSIQTGEAAAENPIERDG